MINDKLLVKKRSPYSWTNLNTTKVKYQDQIYKGKITHRYGTKCWTWEPIGCDNDQFMLGVYYGFRVGCVMKLDFQPWVL
jgi:hypothetical protein